MTVDWLAFLLVVVAASAAATVVVTLFSLALRLGERSRLASVLLFVLCGLAVAAGIVVIALP